MCGTDQPQAVQSSHLRRGPSTARASGTPALAEGGARRPTLAADDGEQTVDHDQELLGLGVAPCDAQ